VGCTIAAVPRIVGAVIVVTAIAAIVALVVLSS